MDVSSWRFVFWIDSSHESLRLQNDFIPGAWVFKLRSCFDIDLVGLYLWASFCNLQHLTCGRFSICDLWVAEKSWRELWGWRIQQNGFWPLGWLIGSWKTCSEGFVTAKWCFLVGRLACLSCKIPEAVTKLVAGLWFLFFNEFLLSLGWGIAS